MSKKQRIIIHFSGIVQGVGFRYTTLQVSRKFPVTGTVKNLQDGRVELVAEGNQDALTAFRSKIEKAMDGYISKTEEKWTEATGHFSNFSISY